MSAPFLIAGTHRVTDLPSHLRHLLIDLGNPSLDSLHGLGVLCHGLFMETEALQLKRTPDVANAGHMAIDYVLPDLEGASVSLRLTAVMANVIAKGA